MRIFSIKNNATTKGQQNFKGKYDFYLGAKPFFTVNKDYHPNSSVEKTLDVYHNNKTGKIYYADPMEPVSDETKNNADYIVYDNEPAYPDVNNEISKNYFGTERVNYRTQFERIRDYFYRREQGGWADKAEAQYQQWQAAECIRLYDEAGDLRYRKETLEDKIKNLNDKIKQTENSINLTNDLIAQKKAELNALKNNTSKQDDDTKNNAELAGLAGASAILANKEKKAEIQSKIKSLKARLTKLNKSLEMYKSVVETESPKINEFKAQLIPLFDKLKDFYAKQGIKKF